MREIRQSGSEGGVALTRHPYPYDGAGPLALEPTGPVALGQTGGLAPPPAPKVRTIPAWVEGPGNGPQMTNPRAEGMV
jgi:hypothetical protein